jgi:tellurite resistance protein
MMRPSTLVRVPAGFFGIVLGVAGLGNAWRAAAHIWPVPNGVGELLFGLAALIWGILIVLFALKWLQDREAALAEARHPVNCCFIGLVGVATMLIGLGALPYSRALAELLYWAGAGFTFAFALWRTGVLWQGGRDPAATTPVLYLPAVAGGYVTAIVGAALGYHQLAQLAFGAAVLTWFAIESVLLNRLYTLPSLPPPLRPSLGIQLAPSTVGLTAYLSAYGGEPGLVAHMLLGYGLLQAALLLRLLPWILRQPFNASYWGFTFGLAALAAAPVRMVAQGDGGLVKVLAPLLFIAVNAVIGLIAVLTIRLMLKGRLLPPPAPTAETRAVG